MNGHGHFKYADGVQYHGTYLNGKKHGFGNYFWTDGRSYQGWWMNNKQHGLGVFADVNKGTKKNGLWENGKRITWFNK
jgi:hypothetical protein